MKITKIAAVLAVTLLSTAFADKASATVFTFDLTDTPHNTTGLGDGGFYKFTGGTPRYDTYSFETNGADVKLRYDDGSNTALITGTAFNTNTKKLAEFNLFYNDITRDGNKLVFGDMDVLGAVEGNTVTGKGFNLTLLDGTLKGDGWLTNSAGTHFGDFHFAGTQVANGGCTGTNNGCGNNDVPVPAPLTLIGAMALFGAWRRKRSTEG